ncbi:MAG: HAMP domain-containing protein [Neisseriaceae bacterium]|nr:HAMP domain-containing protein [Neisseriaceae bacterium]MBP6861512.1 HAMP domain-containing protein [Neisseriaceae bacterium]
MKRFLPNSLFGRLILVLFAGLLISQLFSQFINHEERGLLLSENASRQAAHHIADTVQLLEPLSPEARERAVAHWPDIRLREQPISLRGRNPDSSRSENRFSAWLAQTLGPDYRYSVSPIPSRMMRGERHAGRGPAPYSNAGPGGSVAFLVQVPLKDGQWLIFNSRIPKASSWLSSRALTNIGLLLMVVLALSYVAVRSLTRPLQQLSKAADALGRNINQPPISETGPTEIRQVARAFNLMQGRLQSYIQDRTHVFSAMSHDLKTPITRMRLRTDLLDDDLLRERFEKDLKEMETMVTEALAFMKGLDNHTPAQAINPLALLQSIQTDYLEANKSVSLEGEATPPLWGQAALLKRALVNLIDNALFYGQRADIQLRHDGQGLSIDIMDAGPGISPQDQEKVFQPFFRVESSRNRDTGGTGLGLSIARNIIHSHGGDLSLHNRPEGGLKVSMTLPYNVPD